MAKPKEVTTVLKQDKECKSCVRFRSTSDDEKVTTSLYLVNDSYEKLGSPKEIRIQVSKKGGE